MIHNTQSAQMSQNQDGRNIHAVMKTMCRPGYHQNGFVATHALGAMMSCNYCHFLHNTMLLQPAWLSVIGCSGIVFSSPFSSVDLNVKSLWRLPIWFSFC